jgi:hypothetical protein
MLYKRILPITAIIIFSFFSSFAQNSKGGVPFLQLKLQNQKAKTLDLTTNQTNLSLVQAILSLPDELYALAQNVDHSLIDKAQIIQWSDRETSWIYTIDNPRNEQIQILLRAENFPSNARIFISDPDFKTILGAYDISLFSHSDRLLSETISSRKILLMIDFPSSLDAQGKMFIQKIYRSPNTPRFPGLDQSNSRVDTGFGASYPCHVNVNCPEGDGFENEKRGVTRVHMVLAEGLGWCTGSLINNTAEDEIPYVLTAFHCQDGYTPFYDLWRFDFNYEASVCPDPELEPGKISNTGCSMIAGRQVSDFLLLQMDQAIPPNAEAFFLGWDKRADYTPNHGTIIHHPAGDVKKISKELNGVTIHPQEISWNTDVVTPANYHYRCDFDVATHQGGSSGSALIDDTGRIIGQLHGGITDGSNCNQAIAYSGRFHFSWDDGPTVDSRLKEWLDPLNTNVNQLDGMEASTVQLAELNGKIETPNDQSIANVKVKLSGDQNQIVYSDVNGLFRFENLDVNGQYALSFEKEEGHNIGVSALDMVVIINHLLGLNPFSNMFSNFAADASGDGNLSALDLVQMRNVILGLWVEFPNNMAWRFFPDQIEINAAGDFSGNKEIKGVKTGDVNFSANPGN